MQNHKFPVILLFFTISLTFGCSTPPLSTGHRSPSAETPHFEFIPGERYQETLKPLLDAAKKSIDVLEFNFFTENGVVRDFAEQLIASKKRGVIVRVLIEGDKDLGKPKGAATRNHLTGDLLQKSGITVHYVTGLRQGSMKGVSHAKALCIDGHLVFAGSTNWTNTSITKNNEMNILADSAEIGRRFLEFYESLITDSASMHPLTATVGNLTFLTDTTYFNEAMRIIHGSKKAESLDLSMYFFAYRTEQDTQAKTLFDELVAAHSRGVNIRVFLERNGDPTIAPDVTAANIRVAKLLAGAGISEIYFDPEDKISHTKMLILNSKDSKGRKTALVGSSNWYRGDLNENHQINWLVTDETAVDRLSDYFTDKIKTEGTRFGAD